jgi:two-component system CheB/CheR fusion protein
MVTTASGFYRNRLALERLIAEALPPILARTPASTSCRMWFVGCSTGEEAYELAMDIWDACQGKNVPAIQIFATDVNQPALAHARHAVYASTCLGRVPASRIAQHFIAEGESYRISPDIRNLCVFAVHDVTTDTPFSRMDLIRCGMALSHLDPATQQAILTIFHRSLAADGVLQLQTPCAIDSASSLFEPIDAEHGVYRSRVVPGRHISQSVRRESAPRRTFPTAQARPESIVQRTVDQIVMDRFAPAGVLVTDALEIIQLRGAAERFLEPHHEEGPGNLLMRLPVSMRRMMGDAVHEAQRHKVPVRQEHLPMLVAGGGSTFSYEVIPVITPHGSDGYLILFDEQARPARPSDPRISQDPVPGPVDVHRGEADLHGRVARLNHELKEAHAYIHSVEAERAKLIDQLKDAQDDALSSGEEYRSTNDELQIMKDEVTASNRALRILNATLQSTNADLSAASAAITLAGNLTATIVETMRSPMLVLSGPLVIERMNQAFIQIFGGDRLREVGLSIYDAHQGMWDIPAMHHLLDDILSTSARVDDHEITYDFPGYGERTIRIDAHRIQGDEPGGRLIVLAMMDITKQVQALKDLRSASQDLMRSNADLDHFAVTASHDLQEPLGVVSLYLEILKLQYGSLFDDRAREYMANVASGALRMTQMIRGILAYSRPGNQAMDMVPVESMAILEEATGNLAVAIDTAQAVITHDLLPIICCHRDQITLVFQNLIGNAVKFGRPQAHPVIHVGSSQTDRAWTFTVSDNGIGVKEKDYDAIFQPFHRVHTDRIVKGFGIGLTTCRKIVERHQGRMWVESVFGKGSTFSFTLAKP